MLLYRENSGARACLQSRGRKFGIKCWTGTRERKILTRCRAPCIRYSTYRLLYYSFFFLSLLLPFYTPPLLMVSKCWWERGGKKWKLWLFLLLWLGGSFLAHLYICIWLLALTRRWITLFYYLIRRPWGKGDGVIVVLPSKRALK